MVREVRALGLETCATLGMLSPAQARELKDAGLDYYNHNLDTSESFYREVITTRSYQDRLDTLAAVREAGLNVCCGGILGMGESADDRIALLHTLATLPQHPESVPINQLVQVPGTPLHGLPPLDPLEFVRTIATARLMMPRSYLRLSAGRLEMDDAVQALCFLAGANSIFHGERLLTTPNPGRIARRGAVCSARSCARGARPGRHRRLRHLTWPASTLRSFRRWPSFAPPCAIGSDAPSRRARRVRPARGSTAASSSPSAVTTTLAWPMIRASRRRLFWRDVAGASAAGPRTW